MRKPKADRYPCMGIPYASEKEAWLARDLNYRQSMYVMRDIWTCEFGHWHEGILQ